MVMTGVAKKVAKKKGEVVEQNQDALEYSSEEESEDLASAMSGLANSNVKQKEKVFKIDHNKISYFPFRKNFYVEVPDIARMTPEEVEEYRLVCLTTTQFHFFLIRLHHKLNQYCFIPL